MSLRRILPWTALLLMACQATLLAAHSRPNVIIVLIDDQGYSDLACHGNPILKTPNMDKLYGESIRFEDFHVAPVCTPTRSQIMTGCDCLANGAYAVCSGHGFVRQGIPTMADIFASGGYRTGLFGKWHMGDNYPYRPQDRGFQESVTFPGWGIPSAQDHWNNEYINDWYLHNGKSEHYQGFCTDVWFREAMQWMEQQAKRGEPFFVYLPTNAPHGPNWVPEKYVAPYRGKCDAVIEQRFGHRRRQIQDPYSGKSIDLEDYLPPFCGTIANIDENMGKLDAWLRQSGLYENTILIFLGDNGAGTGLILYTAGMRGGKGAYYEGGHRVHCFMRWPAGKLRQAGTVSELCEGQDFLPTLVDLCGLPRPQHAALDGTSLARLLHGQPQPELADRKLVVQCAADPWKHYEGPTKWDCAVMWNKWRLVAGKELFDLATDPFQKKNIADKHPEVMQTLRDYYERWWAKTEPLAREYQPIHIGSDREAPTLLSSHDWVAPNTADAFTVRAGKPYNGPWHLLVERKGQYKFSLRRWPAEADTPISAGVPAFHGELGVYQAGVPLPIVKARLRIAGIEQSKAVVKEDKEVAFTVDLPAGKTLLQTWFFDQDGKELCGAYYVYVRRVK